MTRKVCVVVGSRANYSSIKSAMKAIQSSQELELQLVLCASSLLDRYGSVANLIVEDSFTPAAHVYMLLEGENPVTMAKSTGIGLMELPSVFDNLCPDIVLTVGDRFETMATTLAATYMNITVAHTMGGEVSGNIDESIRHAVTKFAHIHFPANQDAADRIIRLGEREETVHVVGCPRIDLIVDILSNNKSIDIDKVFRKGVGDQFSLNKPFLLVSQHPVTSEYGMGIQQITETLEAVRSIGLPAVVLWPNADAGADDVARGIRVWREQGKDKNMHFFKNLAIHDYVTLMSRTSCLIGNSSSGIRESAFIGTPCVNIGSRQDGRARGRNVIDATHNNEEIRSAILKQINQGQYECDLIYGEGNAGQQIADILSHANLSVQKRIAY